MNLALVHDQLTQYGGAERVLDVFYELFDQPDIYTTVYLKNKLPDFYKNKNIQTSWVDKLPIIREYHKLRAPLFPYGIESLDLSKYDIILSDTQGIAKGVKTNANQKHISYVYTIPWAVWGLKTGKQNKLAMAFGQNWDYKTAQRPDKLITISKHIQARIRKFWDRDAEVIYPPVEVEKLRRDAGLIYEAQITRIIEGTNYTNGEVSFRGKAKETRLNGDSKEWNFTKVKSTGIKEKSKEADEEINPSVPLAGEERMDSRLHGNDTSESQPETSNQQTSNSSIHSQPSTINHQLLTESRLNIPATFRNRLQDKEDYIIFVGRLEGYKGELELAQACTELKQKVIIVGKGKNENILRDYSPYVELKTQVDDVQKAILISKAKALFNGSVEDFGINMVEALALGTPVIALGIGGAAEIIENEMTGLFFNNLNVEEVKHAIRSFNKDSFDYEYIYNQADKFSKEIFIGKITKAIFSK
jgi:glycosyltransferase involved in cell wall biosynthesis